MANLYSTSVVLFAVLLLGLWLYRATIPRPIPGIPYLQSSANKPFGDVSDALKYFARTQEMISFLERRCIDLSSPICQVFMRPFQPWIVVADHQE